MKFSISSRLGRECPHPPVFSSAKTSINGIPYGDLDGVGGWALSIERYPLRGYGWGGGGALSIERYPLRGFGWGWGDGRCLLNGIPYGDLGGVGGWALSIERYIGAP